MGRGPPVLANAVSLDWRGEGLFRSLVTPALSPGATLGWITDRPQPLTLLA